MDTADFGAFVQSRGPSLLRFGALLTANESEARDLLQDALERVYPRWGRLAAQSPEAYIRKTMVNRLITLSRSPWRRRRVQHEIAEPTESDHSDLVEDRRLVLAALAALPLQMRTVIVLRYWLGNTEAEAAEILDVSVGTVKSQSSRGLARLRTSLEPQLHPTTGVPGDER